MHSLKKEINEIKKKCKIINKFEFNSLFLKFINDVFNHFNKLRFILKRDYSNMNLKWHKIDKDSNKLATKTSLPNSIPVNLKDKIKLQINYKIIYHLTINNKKLTYHIFEKKQISNEIIRKKIIIMNLWMRYLLDNVRNTCSQEINIYLYPIDQEKKFPGQNTEFLGPPHVNTAFTYACIPNNEILIFREEEWFKVFIHETFHSYGIDFAPISRNMDSKVNKMFNLNLNYDITENWCETWARIYNVIITSYFEENNFNNINHFINRVETNIKSEIIFSVFQMCKILKFYNLNFERTMKGKETNYKEKSAVFSYYVLTSLNLVFLNEFIKWSNNNNKPIFYFSSDKLKLESYVSYIEFIKNQAIINPIILCINKIICSSKKTRKNNSLRMSINEIKL